MVYHQMIGTVKNFVTETDKDHLNHTSLLIRVSKLEKTTGVEITNTYKARYPNYTQKELMFIN